MHLHHWLYSYLQPWFTLGENVAVVVAAICAVLGLKGLNVWLRQVHVSNDISTGRKVLLAVNRTRETLFAVRNPFFSEAETDEKKALEQRWLAVSSTFPKLQTARDECQIDWDEPTIKALASFYKVVWEYRLAMNEYWRYPENLRNDQQCFRVIYQCNDDNYAEKLIEISDTIVRLVSPRLHKLN